MSAATDPTESPEWEAARMEWWQTAKVELERLQQTVTAATPGSLELQSIYAPMHDMAGLAGVLGYPLLGKIARSLIETLRKGANPLDDKMLMVAKAHLAALVALHAKDVRGDGGQAGVAVMAKLASIHA
ncbi:MAG: Hpt domain-containing protein [Hyphomonadaceae bacterium]